MFNVLDIFDAFFFSLSLYVLKYFVQFSQPILHSFYILFIFLVFLFFFFSIVCFFSATSRLFIFRFSTLFYLFLLSLVKFIYFYWFLFINMCFFMDIFMIVEIFTKRLTKILFILICFEQCEMYSFRKYNTIDILKYVFVLR